VTECQSLTVELPEVEENTTLKGEGIVHGGLSLKHPEALLRGGVGKEGRFLVTEHH